MGSCKGLTQGETIEATGDYVEHPIYGKQFKITTYHVETPKDSVSMERYLGSGAVKGVGPALAARIVKKFGDDTFRIIEEEPERSREGRAYPAEPSFIRLDDLTLFRDLRTLILEGAAWDLPE